MGLIQQSREADPDLSVTTAPTLEHLDRFCLPHLDAAFPSNWMTDINVIWGEYKECSRQRMPTFLACHTCCLQPRRVISPKVMESFSSVSAVSLHRHLHYHNLSAFASHVPSHHSSCPWISPCFCFIPTFPLKVTSITSLRVESQADSNLLLSISWASLWSILQLTWDPVEITQFMQSKAELFFK